jgi:4-amino-4-deoxy-L-arabinose transferase-like glycosyltransferase
MNGRRVARAWLDPAIASLLALGYAALLLATAKTLGYSRDEGFYFDAARIYGAWFELLVRDWQSAVAPAAVDRHWTANHEHPALMKSLFALSHEYLHERWQWFREPGTAYRFPGMVVSALAIAVTYLWGARAMGRWAGLSSALLFGLMPRVFYHSHLACFDMPVASLWLLTTYAYWRSITTGGLTWAVTTGIFYGLLLNTKHNSWLLPGALVLHWLITRGPALWRGIKQARVAVPTALFAMAIVGPLLFYAGWPWIWRNTGARLAEYVAFHMGHEYYNMEFLGRNYWKPPMPRLYAWVMTAATVPGITLLLFGVGLVDSLRSAIRGYIGPRFEPTPARTGEDASSSAQGDRHSRWETDALWLVCIAFSYAPWLSSNTPIFGGTKHWLTAYPFLCLFAGRGFSLACERLSACFGRSARHRALLAGLVFVSVVTGPLVMTLHSHPWGLSAYTPLVGGASGAATLGLNRTFWGYTTGSVADFLNQHVPPGGSVYVHDTAYPSWEMLRRDGRLRSDITGVGSIDASSFALYHHEPHMGKVEFQTWVAYGTTTPVFIGAYDGVPVIWVYARPDAMQRR